MKGTRCTASSQERSWLDDEWVNSEGYCPDCGAVVAVWVRSSDLPPRAKARAHNAPEGVTPRPFGVYPEPRDKPSLRDDRRRGTTP